MSVSDEYRTIFHDEIELPCKDLIFMYAPINGTYTFQPLSYHCKQNCNSVCMDDCHVQLGALMQKNLVFYAYGEDEVVNKVKSGFFNDLESAAKFAYKNRLPKREPKQDGLPGEVLLDMLVQILVPNAYKLAVRTIFRQDDNNEIKGYDLTYFTLENNHISLWLGQVKFGGKDYCKYGIHKDLLEKFESVYLSKQVFFVAEKQAGLTDEGKRITEIINGLNMQLINQSPTARATALIRFFQTNNIEIKIPCLLAYGEGSVYKDINAVAKCIEDELKTMQGYFASNKYEFDGFTPEIIFFVFPLKDLEKLRSDGGFYAELRTPTT